MEMIMEKIPLFPLGLVLLPGMPLQLHIFEERYKLMMSECLSGETPFGIVQFDGKEIHSVGCMARITEVLHRYEDGRMDIMTRGGQRFFVKELFEEKPYTEARVVFFDDEDVVEATDAADAMAAVRAMLKELEESGFLSDPIDAAALSDPKALSFAIAALEGFTHEERQRFVEMTSSMERLKKSVEALARIVERAQLTQQIEKIIGGNGHPPKSILGNLSK
jgi:Lon protease-like protein